jgi:hypothetical protein
VPILALNLNENSMKTKFFIPVIILFTISISIIACKKNSKTVPVQILLTDNPTNYDEVNVHIMDIKVKMNNDDAGWTNIDAKDTTINLLDLQDGITKLIASGDVPEGVLKEVRFILGSDNSIVVDGSSHPLQTPSAEDSGLKIKIDKHLEETLNTIVLDFDAALSVKEENGSYKLSPVIRVKP